MIFLLSQMAVSLGLAAVVGGCIGWLFHRSRYSGQVDQYRKLVLRQQTQVKQAQSEVNMLADDYDDLKRRSHAEIDTLKQENRQLPALNQNLEKSQLLVRQLMQKHEAQLREISAENETLRTKIKNVDHREQALNQLQAGLEKTRKRAKAMSEAPVDDSDTNLSKPLGAAALATAAAAVAATADAEASDSGDQTSLDLDGEALQETATDDPNDELHEFEDAAYDEDDESDDDTEYEDSDDTDAEYEDDDAEASDDDDGEWEYVYEDEDEEDDDSEYDEEAEYDDDADFEADEEDEIEYLDDASDRMLKSETKSRKKNGSNKSQATKQTSSRKSSAGNSKKQDAGTEEAVTNRSELVDPEPLEQLFDSVDQHDDLQQIFGIGPVTEKALNTLGITSYSQLADLKNHDIEKIADALQIFPGRIERDNWVGSARRQLEEVLEEL